MPSGGGTGFSVTPANQNTYTGIPTGSYTIAETGAIPTFGTQAFTLDDGGAGGTFTPASILINNAVSHSATFTYENNAVGTFTLTVTPGSGYLGGKPAKSVTAMVASATAWYVTPASLSAAINVDTTNYTITAPVPSGSQTFTLTDWGAGGTFTPSSVTITHPATTGTFVYKNPGAGDYTLTVIAGPGSSTGNYRVAAVIGGGGVATYPKAWSATAIKDGVLFAYIDGSKALWTTCNPALTGLFGSGSTGWTSPIQLTPYAEDVQVGTYPNGSVYITYVRTDAGGGTRTGIYRLSNFNAPTLIGDWGPETDILPPSYTVFPNNAFVLTVGTQGSGTFELAWDTIPPYNNSDVFFGGGGRTTGPILYSAAAATIAAALNALGTVNNSFGPNCTVSGTGPFLVTFADTTQVFPGVLSGNGAALQNPGNFSISPSATTLTVGWAGQNTSLFANTIDAATLQGLVQGLSSVGVGAATAIGPNGGPWTIRVLPTANTPPTFTPGQFMTTAGSGFGFVQNTDSGPYWSGLPYTKTLQSQSLGGSRDYAQVGGNALHWVNTFNLGGIRGFGTGAPTLVSTSNDGAGWALADADTTPDRSVAYFGTLDACVDGYRSWYLRQHTQDANWGPYQAGMSSLPFGALLASNIVRMGDGTLAQLVWSGAWFRKRAVSPNAFNFSANTATATVSNVTFTAPTTADTLVACGLTGLTLETPYALIDATLIDKPKPGHVTFTIPLLRYLSDIAFPPSAQYSVNLLFPLATYSDAVNAQIVVGSDNTSGYNPVTGLPIYYGGSGLLNGDGSVDTRADGSIEDGHLEQSNYSNTLAPGLTIFESNLNATDAAAVMAASGGSTVSFNVATVGNLKDWSIQHLQLAITNFYDSLAYVPYSGTTTLTVYEHSTSNVWGNFFAGSPFGVPLAYFGATLTTLPASGATVAVDLVVATTFAPSGYPSPQWNCLAYGVQAWFQYSGPPVSFYLITSRDGGQTWDYANDAAPITGLNALSGFNWGVSGGGYSSTEMMPTLAAEGAILRIVWQETGIMQCLQSVDQGETWS